jgi:hypothetical protein
MAEGVLPGRRRRALSDYPSPDECFARLHRAGWSAGEASFLGAGGERWQVSGSNGENVLRALGASQAEAWWRAILQAEALGMLRRE